MSKHVDDILEIFDMKSEELSDENSDSDEFDASLSETKNMDFDDLLSELDTKIEQVKDVGALALEVDKKAESQPEKKPEPVQEVKESVEKVEVEKLDNESIILNAISDDDSEVEVDIENIFSEAEGSVEDNVEYISSESNVPTAEAEKVEEATELDSCSPEDDLAEDSTESIPFDNPVSVSKETNKESEVKVKQGVKIVDGNIQWIIDPPTEKYTSFYRAKKETLGLILPGGQINFGKYKKEIQEASINVDVKDLNLDDIHDKMKNIQNWRERISQIAGHVNEQYFLWDRFVEMLHGVLARTEYEKPVIRQEGVVFEHMRDMELYNQELKGLHSITASAAKNLDAAWDMLSRTVTLLVNEIQRSDPTRYESKETKERNVKPSQELRSKKSTLTDDLLDGFDGLEGETVIETSNKQKSSQICDWDNL